MKRRSRRFSYFTASAELLLDMITHNPSADCSLPKDVKLEWIEPEIDFSGPSRLIRFVVSSKVFENLPDGVRIPRIEVLCTRKMTPKGMN